MATTARKTSRKSTKRAQTASTTKVRAVNVTPASSSRLANINRRTITLDSLRTSNMVYALLALAQGVALFLFADLHKGLRGITSGFMANDSLASGRAVTGLRHVFDLNLLHVLGALFLIMFVVHLLAATRLHRIYETDIKVGANRLRWWGYALSLGVLIVAVAMASGVFDLSLLIVLFSLEALTCLGALAMERQNAVAPSHAGKLNYWLAVKAGALPLLVVGIYGWSTQQIGSGLHKWQYAMYAVLLVYGLILAGAMLMQYARRAPWTNYAFAERNITLFTFLAQSAIAWLIFAEFLHK